MPTIMLANMVAAIDWILVAQATAAAFTALAAGAAWRAARASRDAVRDHQVGVLTDELKDNTAHQPRNQLQRQGGEPGERDKRDQAQRRRRQD